MARAARVTVNVQRGDDARGPLSRTIPSLQRLCGAERYPEPFRYGQPLPSTRARRVGETVPLGRGPGAPRGTVIGSTAPPRPTLAQLQRGGQSLCERGYWIETEGGVRVAVGAKQIRELLRAPREGLCPHHEALDGYALQAIVAEGRAARVGHPRDVVTDLPFPHRKGSSPCCAAASVTPELVLAVLRDWSSGEGWDELTEREMIALARRAVTRTSPVTPPRTVAEIPEAMKAVRDHCWRLWTERAAQATEGRAEKFKRLKATVRAQYAPPQKTRPQSAPQPRRRTPRVGAA